MIDRIRYLYFNGIIRQDVIWFDYHDSKTLSTRIIDDTSNMKMGIDVACTIQSVA